MHVGQTPGLADADRFARYSKGPQMAVLLLLTARLEHATNLLANAFPAHLYGDRLTVGRRAQLGPDMVYRTSIGGNSVDSSLTYGEYDLGHFAALVDRALDGKGQHGRTFVDVGSGCGRLVFAAAALWPALACVAGVERIEEMHEMAMAACERVTLPEPPTRRFFHGDVAHLLGAGGALADADVLFAYSSTWAGVGDVLTDFSATCGTLLRVGARVVTTDKRLIDDQGWSFELLEAIDGPNRETGGSVGYVHEVTRSIRGAE